MIHAENILICLIMPNIVSLLLLRGSARRSSCFFLLGMLSCLLSSYISGFFMDLTGTDLTEAAFKITPICEEIMKSLPVLLYLILFAPGRERILPASVSMGVGFATFESCCYMVQYGSADIGMLLIRGLGAGVMHTLATAIVGYGLSLAVYRKLGFSFICVLSLLCISSTIHAIYNLLVSTEDYRQYIGYVMPVLLVMLFLAERDRIEATRAAVAGKEDAG